MSEVTGRCLCGTVRYRIDGSVRDRVFCHCESCRRAVGASPVAWGTTDIDKFHVTTGELSVTRSSKNISRGFCALCGCSLTYYNELRSTEIDFTLTSLDNPEPFAPEAHIWTQDKLSWIPIAEGLPVYTTVVGGPKST